MQMETSNLPVGHCRTFAPTGSRKAGLDPRKTNASRLRTGMHPMQTIVPCAVLWGRSLANIYHMQSSMMQIAINRDPVKAMLY
jgi:hypothetical protein